MLLFVNYNEILDTNECVVPARNNSFDDYNEHKSSERFRMVNKQL